MNKSERFISLFFSVLVLTTPAEAFDINGSKWPGAVTDFYFDIDGQSASGVSWNTALTSAAEEWSAETRFQFSVIPQYRNPCAFDSVNGVDFQQNVCGNDFGEGVLAVALRSLSSALLGPTELSEADIVFNSSRNFDIYDGRLVQFGFPVNRVDFRRVALHELGHTLGLDHEDGDNTPAIMASNIGNLDRLQQDDIAGVNTLYGGLDNCEVTPLRLGVTANSLASGDCTVDELTVGTGDGSFVDIYRVSLAAQGTLSVNMTSATLDSVLILADAELNYLATDQNAIDVCNSSISRTLAAGEYLLIANTFNTSVKPECDIQGPYELVAELRSDAQFPLLGNLSINGSAANAQFSGGIRVNNQAHFQNTAQATDSLDIEAAIAVDSSHVGSAGFLVIAGFLGDQTFLMNETGEFINVTGQAGALIVAARKTLESSEELVIAENLVPEQLGLTKAEVNFIVGYGVDTDSGEVYFHEVPLNLSISP